MKIFALGESRLALFLLERIKEDHPEVQIYAAPGQPYWEEREVVTLRKYNPDKGDRLVHFLKRESIDFTLLLDSHLGQEGLVDHLVAKGHKVFGPLQHLYQWKKNRLDFLDLLSQHGLPLCDFRNFQQKKTAYSYLEDHDHYPLFIKSVGEDGCEVVGDFDEAKEMVKKYLKQPRNVDLAPRQITVEEVVKGPELRFYFLIDGDVIIPLDWSRIYRQNPQSLRPHPHVQVAYFPWLKGGEKFYENVEKDILVPLAHIFTAEKLRFRGLLELDLRLPPSGPKVIDLNLDWDPVVFPALLFRWQGSLLPFLEGTAGRSLKKLEPPHWSQKPSLSLGLDLEESARTIEDLSSPDGELVVTSHAKNLVAITTSAEDLGQAIRRLQEFCRDIHLELPDRHQSILDGLGRQQLDRQG